MHALRWAFALLALAGSASAIGQDTCVAFKSSASTFPVISKGRAAPILLSADEWGGVQRAARDFADDIHKVTGVMPTLANVTSTSKQPGASAIIVGTLGHSTLIDQIVSRTKLDVSSIEGKWESFMARKVEDPLPGVKSAYVVIGSDKRGSIFGLYDHSEQFGVSPWYWWADVPPTKHSELHVQSTGCSHGAPSVKYRFIFINDEQPSITNWALEKFTNGTGAAHTGSPFNHFFYTKLFELILRLKGNGLWPAIWSSAFGIDDPQNQPLADWFGIVMGTSHQEPFMRSSPVEWNIFGSGPWDYSVNAKNLTEYFREGIERSKTFENIVTIGMRGAGDLPLSETQNIQLLEKIVADQRNLLEDVFNTTDLSNVTQVWTLYKEVEGYYRAGMRVPDDVILLWPDDNWGNVRRYPLVSERNRTGGTGVYYHVDYVGDPRNYKWITSSQIEKTFEQMSAAVDREATKLWVLNVGDLKPYEMHTEFFLNLGWHATRWTPANLNTFVTGYVQREFDLSPTDAKQVAGIIGNVTRWNARRKPEIMNSMVYSLTNYREADNAMADWQNLVTASTNIYNRLSPAVKPAFFQLVQHPVTASATLARMWIAAGKNNLAASQARVSANNWGNLVESLFAQDYSIETDYHSILDGKWDHMMDQTHVMYYYWQQPMANTMPPITKVQSKKQALAGPMRITIEGSAGAWPGDNMNNCALGYNCPPPTVTLDSFSPAGNVFVDVGSGGPSPFTFTAKANETWVKLSSTKGAISLQEPEQRVFLSADWSKVTGAQAATVTFIATAPKQPQLSVVVNFVANHTTVPHDFKGFVEGDGAVSIEAAHTSRNSPVDGIVWTNIPGLGRTLSGLTPWPRGGADANFSAGTGPQVDYDFFLFNTRGGGGGNVSVTAYVSPSLNGLGDDRPLGLAMGIDDGPVQSAYFVPSSQPGNVPAPWNGLDGWVANSIIEVPLVFDVQPGAHTLKVWMIEPMVVLQKIVIDTGGVKPSFLGPPESIRV